MRMNVRKKVKLGFIEKQKSRITASEKRAEGELMEQLNKLCELWKAKSCLIVLPLPSKGEDGASKFTMKKKTVNPQKNNRAKEQLMKLYEKILREKGQSSSSSLTYPSVFVEPDVTPVRFDHQKQYQNLYEYYKQIPEKLEEYRKKSSLNLKPKEPVQIDCQPLYDFYEKLPQKLHEFNMRYNLKPNPIFKHGDILSTDSLISSDTSVTDDDDDDDDDCAVCITSDP